MANLIELSRKLKVRAEVLQKRLEEIGLGAIPLDENLPGEMETFLRDAFHVPFSERLRSRFASLLNPFRGKPEPEPPIPARAERGGVAPVAADEAERALEEWRAVEEPPGADQTLTELLPPSAPEAEGFAHEEALETAPAPIAPPPVQREAVEHPPLDLPPVDDLERLSTLFVPSASPGEAHSDLLLTSLEAIEKVRESLAEVPEPTLDAPQPEVVPEEGMVPSEEAEPEIEEFVLPGPREEMSSAQLQAYVDELTRDIHLLERVDELPSEPVRRVIHRSLAGVLRDLDRTLTWGHKAALSGAILAALVAVGLSLHYRDVNYGEGGDERFYREGVAALRSRNPELALESFGKVIERFPESPLIPQSLSRMAEARRALGELKASISTLERALAIHEVRVGKPTTEWSLDDLRFRWEGRYTIGDTEAEKKDWGAAAESFEKVIHESRDDRLKQRSLYRYAEARHRESEEVETREAAEVRGLLAANERALEASPESEYACPTLRRSAELWEELAELEFGFRKENLEKALGCIEKLLAQGDRLVAAGMDPRGLQLAQGRVLRELGRHEESVALHRKILSDIVEEEPDKPPPFPVVSGLARSLLGRAEAYVAGGKPASAEADLMEAVEFTKPSEERPFSEEELTEALYLRGHAEYQIGMLKSSTPEGKAAAIFNRMETAYRSALARNDHFGPAGRDSLLAMMRRTNYLFSINKDFRDAAESYRRILELFPKNVYAYRARFRLATALFELGEYLEAEQEFQKVVDLFNQTRYTDDEAFRESYFRLGHCQFLQQDYSRATATLKSLLGLLKYEKTPEALSAWRILAEAHFALGQYDEAVEELQGFLSRYPDEDSEGKIRWALSRALIARFDYEKGREELQRLVDKFPNGEVGRWARYLICESYLNESRGPDSATRRGLLDLALESANAIRVRYPGEDAPLQLLGRIYFELGDYERAARDLEYYHNAARGHKPQTPTQFLLAQAYFNLKRYERAIDLYRSMDISQLSREEAARALYQWAESLRFENRFSEADSTYSRLLKDFPVSSFSELALGRRDEVRWRMAQGF
ncbi:MAG: tetratricopeptide repeat protein [Candidatus Omnitrophica bacterium]|nr:Outer membrane protein assembly factor BamD [bacterium]NUN97055.1 tetratricopeptide repeat protein [Candidatus Omnitrophota bacterium]